MNANNPLSSSVAILVVSCDKYSDLWEPFFRCFAKYWPDCPFPIYLGSNKIPYEGCSVRSITVGDDVSYSDNLKKMLNDIPQDWVVCWLEDRILSAKVDTARVHSLVQSAIIRNAAYLKLIPEHPIAYGEHEEVGVLPVGLSYRVSMTVALWKKADLLLLLRAGESAWDLEKQGSRRSNTLCSPFLGLGGKYLNIPPLKQEHIIVKGRIARPSIEFIKREGLDALLSKRSIESRGAEFYAIVHRITFRLIRPIEYGVKRFLSRLTASRR